MCFTLARRLRWDTSMNIDVPYGITRRLRGVKLDDARARTTKALQAEGFGVLTEIDVQATLKKKLDVDTAPYVILGACNPKLAHAALTEEPGIGLLLPCTSSSLWTARTSSSRRRRRRRCSPS